MEKESSIGVKDYYKGEYKNNVREGKGTEAKIILKEFGKIVYPMEKEY